MENKNKFKEEALAKLKDACNKLNDAEAMLEDAIKKAAKSIGFSEEESLGFSATFASGGETVVHWDLYPTTELESDLDITKMLNMTKDEVIEYFENL